MTRTFNEKLRCTNCRTEFTAETDFERWVRLSRELDASAIGICRFDLDVLLHRYKLLEDGKGCRDIQCMMFIEVKTRMADPSDAQRDTLSIFNQVLRNRKPNIHTRPRRQMGGGPNLVYSQMLGREVTLKMYGGHLLQLSGTTPENSETIVWDWTNQITATDLVELLRFERDPDRPKNKLDHRRRSTSWKNRPKLFS